MGKFVDSAYNPETGKGYGSRPVFEVFEQAVITGDYAVIKAMTSGSTTMMLPISVKRHLPELLQKARLVASPRSRNNMVKLLNKIAEDAGWKASQ